MHGSHSGSPSQQSRLSPVRWIIEADLALSCVGEELRPGRDEDHIAAGDVDHAAASVAHNRAP
jgi:hypothetical protein